jgi:hypothetical protein
MWRVEVFQTAALQLMHVCLVTIYSTVHSFRLVAVVVDVKLICSL